MEAVSPTPVPETTGASDAMLTPPVLAEEESRLRRRLVIICTLFAIPMLLLFSIIESAADKLDMVIVNAGGAGICLLLLHLARRDRLNRAILRASIGYMFMLVLYYVSTDFLPSSLLFVMLLPFASAFLLGYRESAIWNAALGSAVRIMILYADVLGLSTLNRLGVDFLATYVFICLIACAYERSRHLTLRHSLAERQALMSEIETKNRMTEKNQRLFSDLQHALREVRELTGLVPICASCKKIRSDEDYWEHVEGYLHRRTQLTFSHSICPCCSEKAMAALDEEDPQARAG